MRMRRFMYINNFMLKIVSNYFMQMHSRHFLIVAFMNNVNKMKRNEKETERKKKLNPL